MKRKIGELIIIFIFYILQVTLDRTIGINGIAPNFLIILPILFGFFNGQNDGIFVGFFAGILYDLFSFGLFGFSSLIFIFIGYVAGIFQPEYEDNELVIPIAVLIVGDFVYEFLSYVGNFLLHNNLNAGHFISRYIIPEIIYTSIVMVLLFKLLLFINGLLKPAQKRSSNILDERIE